MNPTLPAACSSGNFGCPHGIRASYIDRGSPFDSRVRLYHHDGGFYELSVRDVRSFLDLMFRGGTPRSRLMRLYKHARQADCLSTRCA